MAIANDVDLYVGKRIRRRRRLLGLTQQDLAAQVGVKFQQIQKYECGGNRVTASRLFALSTALNVNLNYFVEGLAADGKQAPANDVRVPVSDASDLPGFNKLAKSYVALDEPNRKRLVDLGVALSSQACVATAS